MQMSLIYPVLIYNDKFVQGKLNNKRDLCIRTINSFNAGFFDGLKIIDSKGRLYEVVSYENRYPFHILVQNFLDSALDLFLRPKGELSTWIDFELSEYDQLTFDEVKRTIVELVNKNPRWFKKGEQKARSIKEALGEYRSIVELNGYFSGYP